MSNVMYGVDVAEGSCMLRPYAYPERYPIQPGEGHGKVQFDSRVSSQRAEQKEVERCLVIHTKLLINY